ncbi:hypothetical protein ACFLSS_04645, partial [Bacteroidota bacterium]
MLIRLILFLVIIPLLNLEAQLSSFDYNGYAKYLFSSTKFAGSDDRYSDNLIHLRLNTKWYPTNEFTSALDLRFRAFYGESVQKLPNFSNLVKSKRDWVNLDCVIWDKNKTVGYLEVDRLWIDWVKGNFQATVGRQRIAWGTAWVWNPTDLFNPLDVLDFDYEELPGVDAVRMQYYTGAVTKIEGGYKPAKDKRDVIIAGLWSINLSDYDFNLIAGMRDNRWIAGGSWAGDILNAGFRGEIIISEAPDRNNSSLLFRELGETSLSSFSKPMIAVALSGDYTFPNTFYIHTELLYNNSGKTKYTLLHSAEARELGMLTAARWAIYQEFAYEISPLLRGILFGIFNPNDKSYIIVPS